MNKKTKKRSSGKLGTFISVIFFMIIGAVCGLIITDLLPDSGNNFGSFVLQAAGIIIGMYAMMLIEIIIHEAGHLVFGLLSGYSFCSFRIGSLMWQKDDTGVHFRRFSLAGTGGQCLMAPPDLADGRIPYMLYNLGGSLMNLISVPIFLGLYFILVRFRFISSLMLVGAVIAVAYALMNGIPMHVGSVDNDGLNALNIGRTPGAMRAFWIQLKLNEQSSKGLRLKDMPADWFALPDDAQLANGIISSLAVFACNRLMDEHRFDEANAQIQAFLAKDSATPCIYKSLLICDSIYCELIGLNYSERLDSLYTKEYKKFEKSMKTYPAIIRTQYAYALLHRKDEAAAQAVLKRFEAAAKNYPMPVDIEAERELLEIARQSLENTENASINNYFCGD